MRAACLGTLRISFDTVLSEDHIGNVVFETNNVTLDCAGFALRGNASRCTLVHSNFNIFERNDVNDNAGFHLDGSSGNSFTGNVFASNSACRNGGLDAFEGDGANIYLGNTFRTRSATIP